MACKYYKSGICNDFCRAKGRDEKITYAHAKNYCMSNQHEKCNAYKETLKTGLDKFVDDLFKW